ncbi:hypothetical protein F4805DRAFT_200976 [Annulohypoxylon moriforme]|nr:hypothetical protein F4805DRAFT_200976 [Annulohypoxylon moriforme]
MSVFVYLKQWEPNCRSLRSLSTLSGTLWPSFLPVFFSSSLFCIPISWFSSVDQNWALLALLSFICNNCPCSFFLRSILSGIILREILCPPPFPPGADPLSKNHTRFKYWS